MAAGEDEPQPIVLDPFLLHGRLPAAQLELVRQRRQRGVEAGPAPQHVDGLEPAGRDQPRPGIRGDPVARPLLGRGGEGVVERLLRPVEVAQQADHAVSAALLGG